MRKNLIFETNSGNKYLHTVDRKYNIFVPPALEKFINSNPQDESPCFNNDKEYYARKYDFLLHNGFIEKANIAFLEKPDPNIVKMKLANLRQLVFEVTDDCNLRCYYCAYGKLYGNYDERKSRKLSFVLAKKVIDYMISLWNSSYNTSFNNIVDISFYGGEPLINFELIKQIISYLEGLDIKNLNFTYRMTTNAMLLNKYMDYLVDKKFNLLISIDGDEYGDSYRVTKSGKNSFKHVYENILLLKNKYPDYYNEHVDFNAVLHDRNSYESIFLFIKEHFDKGAKVSELSDAGILPEKMEEFKSMFKSSYDEQVKFFYTHREIAENNSFKRAEDVQLYSLIHGFTGNKYNSFNELLKDEKKVVHMPSGTCMAFYKKMFVTVNGKIFPCEKIGQRYPLGFVSEEDVDIDFDRISSIYEEMYKPLLKICENCYHQDSCAQCVFLIYEKRKGNKFTCPTFVNKHIMQDYLSRNLSYAEENTFAYEKIVSTDLIYG